MTGFKSSKSGKAKTGFGSASKKTKTGFNSGGNPTATGFSAAPVEDKGPGWLKRNFYKATLAGSALLVAASYVGEAWHHIGNSDHLDKHGTTSFVIDEIGYDMEDASMAVSSLWSSADERPEEDGRFMLIREEEGLKILFCVPRHLDNNFNEMETPPVYQKMYKWQEAYVMSQVGDKATEVGMALAHDRLPIVHMLSETEILNKMSTPQKEKCQDMDEDEYAEYLGVTAARKYLDIQYETDHDKQKPRNDVRFKAHYTPVTDNNSPG